MDRHTDIRILISSKYLFFIRVGIALAILVGAIAHPNSLARAASLQPGFQETIVFSGLVQPTVIQFSPDGRIFIAEKRGVIKVFDSLSDTTPDIFADLNVNVYNFWDRGLLGMALDPNFPVNPYVYVLYTFDAAIGGTAPRWGTPGVYSDPCPTPPGATADGCVVSGRLSRLQASGNLMTGNEQVLIEDWCQQYPSHSIGSLVFGPDGALYVSGGDGASFNFVDYGQDGNPLNPCGDPPGGVGGSMTPPTAEGGALRSQDLRSAGDPVTLDGAVLRVDPATGAGLPDNPRAGDADPNARRIIAHGLRNPFRITVRPGSEEIWIGDVGWNLWEEINRIVDPNDAVVDNFGWPCYEGNNRQSGYDNANLTLCESLYATPGAVTAPYYTYHHSSQVVPNEVCPTGGSSIAGLSFQFYTGGVYPNQYDGALFFADYSRDCIWAMFAGAGSPPNPSDIETFVGGAANPVDLKISPSGELFYADFDGGTIRRIDYISSVNQPPNAIASANPTAGEAPLLVNFDGSASSDPDPSDSLTYAWDLDGDNAFDDATTPQAAFTYTLPGSYTATLRVTDSQGASATATIVITVGNTSPTASINSPAPGTTWKVGDVISFSGSASDVQDGALPASALTWSLVQYHCPSNCHAHTIQDFTGVSSGSFTAPDHEYPSYLELHLTATDSGGLQDTQAIRLDPQTVVLTFQTNPGGLLLTVGGIEQRATFTRTVIVGSRNTISAYSQKKGKSTYNFVSWSDGGAPTHDIFAPASPQTYTARFRR